MQLLGFALASLIGLSLGIMGGGGSILTVPIFVYVMGFDPKLAIAMSLPVVGGTSLIGAIGHWKAGNVNPKTATLFGAIAMVGAYAGARLAVFLTGAMQLALLAIVMLAAAVSMLRSARRDAPRGDAVATPDRPMSLGLLLPVAIAVGLLTGLVGSLASIVTHGGIVLSAGASGALFGILGGLGGYLARHGRTSIPRSVVKGLTGNVVTVIAINLAIGFTIPRIDNSAHLGGLFSGFLFGLLLAQPLSPAGVLARGRRAAIVGVLGLGSIAAACAVLLR